MYMKIKETTVVGAHSITQFVCPECGYEMEETVYYIRKYPPLKQCPLCQRDKIENERGFFVCDECAKKKKLSERVHLTLYKQEVLGKDVPISREVICRDCYLKR